MELPSGNQGNQQGELENPATAPFRILFLLGFCGMFLSEGLIWNVSTMVGIYQKGPHAMLNLGALAWILYTLQFAIFADLVHRFSVKDFTGMILLGCLHGLLLEGVFANIVFSSPFPPRIFGLSLPGCAFPALSWHAALDFTVPFLFLKKLADGEIRLDESLLKPRPLAKLTLLALFWFSWSESRIHQTRFPDFPPEIRFFFLFFPMVVLGFVAYLNRESTKTVVPREVLSTSMRRSLRLLFLFFFLAKGMLFPNKAGYLAFSIVLGAYGYLFLIWNRKTNQVHSPSNFWTRTFPFSVRFSLFPYLISCCWITVLFLGFRSVSGILWFKKAMGVLSVCQIRGWLAFATIFPIWVVFQIWKSGRTQVSDFPTMGNRFD